MLVLNQPTNQPTTTHPPTHPQSAFIWEAESKDGIRAPIGPPKLKVGRSNSFGSAGGEDTDDDDDAASFVSAYELADDFTSPHTNYSYSPAKPRQRSALGRSRSSSLSAGSPGRLDSGPKGDLLAAAEANNKAGEVPSDAGGLADQEVSQSVRA